MKSRLAFSQIDRQGSPEPYEVTIRSVAAYVAVSLRRTCGSYDDVSDLLQTCERSFRRARWSSAGSNMAQVPRPRGADQL